MEKVSVVVPVYNSSQTIMRCLNSVLNQSYLNLEVLVVDDCSTDNTSQIVKSIEDSRIIYVRLEKNSGVACARNKGISLASGEYLCFIDSDDFWKPDKIERQVDFMKKNHYSFTYGSYYYHKNGKNHLAKVPSRMTYLSSLKNTAIFTSTVMFRLSDFDRSLLYMPLILKGQDTATWWNVLRESGGVAYCVPGVYTYYSVGNKSLSHNKISALKRTWALYKRENLSFYKKIYYYFCYVYHAIVRRIF